MAVVGVVVLMFYLSFSAFSASAVITLWRLRPDPLTTAAVGTAAAVVLGYLSFRFGTVRLPSQLDAWDMSPTESPSTHRLRDYLTERMDLSPPTLELARFVAPNAMAPDPMGHDAIVLDASLFRLPDADEFEALLTHELVYLERKGGLAQSFVVSILQTVVGVGYLFVSSVMFLTAGVALGLAWVRGRPGLWTETFAGRVRLRLDKFIGLSGFGLTVFVRLQSREREFAADARIAEVTDKLMALTSALWKLERAARPRRGLSPLQVYGKVEVESSVSDLLSTHLSADERVERLAAMADESVARTEVR